MSRASDERPTMPLRSAGTAAGAAVLAAVVLPGARVGVGVVLVALALAWAAAGATERVPARLSWSRVWAATSLVLTTVPLWRDAVWVVVAALGGAAICGTLAVTGGATWTAIARGPVMLARRILSGSGALAVLHAGRAALPHGGAVPVLPAARGAGLAVGLVVVFGALFASADRAFAELAQGALPTSWDPGPLAGRVAVLAGVLALAGALVAARPVPAGARPATRRLGALEWAAALAALDLLFAVFVGVQLTVLFGRHAHVLKTAGLTYAEYAHEGFGQLLAVAALTLAVAGAALRWSPPGRRLLVRALLGVLFALTFVVLASALHRLGLYEQAFGATRLRLAAQWALIVVGALLAVVLCALATGRFDWLPRAAVLCGALALLAGAVADPDRRIAERNLDRLARTGEVDAAYLEGLSADATPVLPARFAARQRTRLARGDGWSGFSFARERARAALR